MKTWMIGVCAVLTACAGMTLAESAKAPGPVWDVAKDDLAGTTGRIKRVNGRRVPTDCRSGAQEV
jgi:hypothetical protein